MPTSVLTVYMGVLVVLVIIAIAIIAITATRARKTTRSLNAPTNTNPIPEPEKRNPATRIDSPAIPDERADGNFSQTTNSTRTPQDR